jgi:hypothetical protein
MNNDGQQARINDETSFDFWSSELNTRGSQEPV